jgi:type II secretory pathway pseudopilin PulG
MQRTLTQYRIGLGVIGLFTLVVLILVVAQASATRKDQQTENAANSIATKLNDYTDASSTGVAPASLSQVGINSIPDTISYERITSYTYYFCAKYQEASTDFSTSNITQELVLRGFGAGPGDTNGSNIYNNLPYLEINPVHRKGWNCQTVDLSSYGNNTSSSNYSSL